MAKKTPGLGLDVPDSSTPDDAPAVDPGEPARLRQGNQPLCEIHVVQMRAYSSSAMYTYYKCPQPGCGTRDKRVRPVGPLKSRYGNKIPPPAE